MKRHRSFAVLLVLVFLVSSCATLGITDKQDSPKMVAWKTLSSAATVYNKTMTAVAELYKKGVLTENDKAKAIELGNKFKLTFDFAVTKANEGDFSSVVGVSAVLAELVAFIQPFIIKGGTK